MVNINKVLVQINEKFLDACRENYDPRIHSIDEMWFNANQIKYGQVKFRDINKKTVGYLSYEIGKEPTYKTLNENV